jgi:hypothetical protein
MSSAAAATARAETVSPTPVRDPVSPELVLVDPELARIERLRIAEAEARKPPAEVVEYPRFGTLIDISTLRRAAESQPIDDDEADAALPVRFRRVIEASRSRLVLAVLLLSIFGNGLFVSRLVAHQDPPMTQAAAVTTVVPATSPATPPPAFPHPRTKASLERTILFLVLRSPKAELPPQLIDSTTGLLKNNVQVSCRRALVSRSFLCIVRAATRPEAEGLYVRYWPTRRGRAAFHFYGYRER